jgi:hypothetical protein
VQGYEALLLQNNPIAYSAEKWGEWDDMHKTSVSVYDTAGCWGAWRVQRDTGTWNFGPEQNGGQWYKESITNL